MACTYAAATAAGILTVEAAFPITIGAILASFATGNPSAITIAFAHFLFNLTGTVLIYPIRFCRMIPIHLAKAFGDLAAVKRRYAAFYVVGVFFLIPTLFGQTKGAFMEGDEDKAGSAWDYEKRIAKGCDKIVADVARSDLSVNEAVCLALVARHFKRIVADLVDITTSVILPLSDLDYFDERTREG